MSTIIKYSLLSFPLASIGLGVWQLRRLEWKNDLIAKLEERLTSEPLDLLQIESTKDLHKLEYRRVKAKGRFDTDPNNQIILKPRPLVVNKEAIHRGKTDFQSNVGLNVVTPFSIDDTNLRILVNRGWLPTKGYEDITLKPESVELVGILRTTDKRPTYGMKNDEKTNVWQIRDIEAMSRALKTAPIFLDKEQELHATEGPIGGQTQLNVRNEHLNYAITWFALSLFSFAMWFSKYGMKKKRR